MVCLLNSLLMHLLRCLSFYAVYYRFTFEAAHIPGIKNVAADAISCNNIPLFLSLQPQATQVTVPRLIMELLVTKQPDWGSYTWTHLFKASLTRPCQIHQTRLSVWMVKVCNILHQISLSTTTSQSMYICSIYVTDSL